ncbi:hypothetical protein AJ80_03997 [Polytolypa hystricis UAMH7299]|uniref:Aminoglycoside phosphotransferase domain-containing protein n=1 Tax=Polytolypa hystricis (strain UAMH7299) TaxID=1447883 RepID=A0A2B7YFI4_POLH7|nr:hypothetical protein AJ80_03997 [Polytolypa hystricis UAMH7299]
MDVSELKGDLDELYRSRSSYWVEGPNPGVQGIAKIRMQLPDDPENPSATKPQRCSTHLGFEYYNHLTLTNLGCTCIPKLLDCALLTQKEGDPLPGGFFFFLVMERLPGCNLVNFGDLPMSERDQVRWACAKSIRDFYAFRYMHDDPDRGNLMCYIIDLEDAYQINDDQEPTKFMPTLHYRE